MIFNGKKFHFMLSKGLKAQECDATEAQW